MTEDSASDGESVWVRVSVCESVDVSGWVFKREQVRPQCFLFSFLLVLFTLERYKKQFYLKWRCCDSDDVVADIVVLDVDKSRELRSDMFCQSYIPTAE